MSNIVRSIKLTTIPRKRVKLGMFALLVSAPCADAGISSSRFTGHAPEFTTLAGNIITGYAVNGTGAAASFNTPTGVGVDSSGNVFVADTNDNMIREISAAGLVTTFAGNLGFGAVNGTGTAATFNQPFALAFDSSGNMFVAEQSNNLIRKITTTGVVSTFAGSGSAGSANGTGTAASFNAPSGVAIDSSNNIFVADRGNNLIRKITTAGVVTTFAGSGTAGSTNGTGTAASFNAPFGITISSSGNLYVADRGNNLIRKITTAAAVTTFAGSGAAGAANGTGTAATFNGPTGITVTASSLYVADTNNQLIRAISSSAVVTTFAGSGAVGSTNATGTAASFNNPYGLGMDGSGNIYVAEQTNAVIRKITSGGVVTTLAGSGPSGSVDGTGTGTGTGASFYQSLGIAFDASGNAFVADSNNSIIRKVTPAGVVTTFAGSGSQGSANGTGTAASFNNPSGIAIDSSGNLYVADTNNGLIRKITTAGVVSTFAGSGASGSANGTGTAASFGGPYGIVVDSSGNLFVSEVVNSLIRKITPAAVVTTFAGSGSTGSTNGTGTAASFHNPGGLAIDSANTLYLADTNNASVRKITSAAVVTTLAGSGSQGSANGTGTAASFSAFASLATDSSGNVYVADRFNGLLRKVTPAGKVTTIAGGGPTGYFSGANRFQTQLFQPLGIAVQGKLLYVNMYNGIIATTLP